MNDYDRKGIFLLVVLSAFVFCQPVLAEIFVAQDLGTLGGNYSEAVGINDSGVVIGSSRTFSGATHAFVIVPVDSDADGVPDTWFRDDDSDGANDLMVDLGTLKYLNFSTALAINQLGQIVGSSLNGFLIAGIDANGDGIADSWFKDEDNDGMNDLMIDLGNIGQPGSRPVALNNSGMVVGTGYNNGDSSQNPHAFIWRNGQIEDMGTLGRGPSGPSAINDAGKVVGYSYIKQGSSSFHAFLWEDGVMRDLGVLRESAPSISVATSINNSGQVVGHSTISSDSGHAFLWEDGVMSDLGTLGGNFSAADKINEKGEVAGISTAADGKVHLFIWGNGSMVDIGTLGEGYPKIHRFNDMGYMAGQFGPGYNPGAFAWFSEKGLIFLPPLGKGPAIANDINKNGIIVGGSTPPLSTDSHAVLWRPIPVLQVSIDIKPDDKANTVNLASAGVIQVAILSSEIFNATIVKPETVNLSGASVKLLGKSGKYSCYEDDVNGDGLMDIVCHLYTNQLLIEEGNSQVILNAETSSSLKIRGVDNITVVRQ